jgi:hypothetical protein
MLFTVAFSFYNYFSFISCSLTPLDGDDLLELASKMLNKSLPKRIEPPQLPMTNAFEKESSSGGGWEEREQC